jgi:mercuric ion transport protein
MKFFGGLTGIACALCCAIPFLIAAGVLGGAGWVVLGQVLPGIALVLAALTGLVFWRQRRRREHVAGCAGGTCTCS